MKKSQAFLLSAVFLLVFFVAGLWFQSRRLLPAPKLHEFLIQKVQALTDGTLKYQKVSVGYFPQPKIVFEKPQLSFSGRPLMAEAEKIQFDFNILPLLIGRVEPAAFYVQSGKAEIAVPGLSFMDPVVFENFSLQVGAVTPKIPIPFHFVSDMSGKPNALVMKGNVVLDSVEEWNWERASGSVVVELKGLSLDPAARGLAPDPKRSFFFKKGQIDTLVEIRKKPFDAFLELTASGTGKGLVYDVPQENNRVEEPSLDAEWNASAAWNNDTAELKIHKVLVKLPFGSVETNGSMKLDTGEITSLHTTGSDMALEDILKYWPGLENALPFHMGFSGPGKWVLSMEGTLDHLSLHFGWDLTKVLLSYGQYFTKPKDIPLELNFDLLLQRGSLLGGDFAVKFQELSVKGNLKDLDLKTGNGQLNLITNKFSVTGWEQYIPAIQGFKLAGDAKLMANWKGDLRKLEKAEHIFNLSFEKASCANSEGIGFRNATLSLDYSPLMMEGRQMQFEIGEAPIVVDLKISGFPEKPQADIKVSAAEIKPLEAWRSVEVFLKRKGTDSEALLGDRVKEFIQDIFPEDQSLKNLAAEIIYAEGVWNASSLQFEAYRGKAKFIGALNLRGPEAEYGFDAELQGLDLGLFLGRQDVLKKVLEGALDLKGSMAGKGWGSEAWSKSLEGQGDWTLKNGRLVTFDPKDAIATLEHFSGLGAIRPSFREFDSMKFEWKIGNAKAATDNLLVKSGDYVMDGEGTLGFDGLANFRLDVFLSSDVAMKLFPDIVSDIQKDPQAHMGPVAMLFSGSLAAPDMKPEPAQTEELTEKIRRGKAKEFIYELVTE